jgi:hypothetical protein
MDNIRVTILILIFFIVLIFAKITASHEDKKLRSLKICIIIGSAEFVSASNN